MSESALIQVRIDAETKSKAVKLFKRLGFSTSEAVRMFFAQAIEEKAMPFHSHIPNTETRQALQDAENGNVEYVSLQDLRKQILGDA